MTVQPHVLTICRPDDWHLHLRNGEILKTVLPYTSKFYGRAIIMPNLVPPITTVQSAFIYQQYILSVKPISHNFTPLMTCYLTDSIDPNEIEHGFKEGIFIAAKLYPINATTNSSCGITSIDSIMPILERMEKLNMTLLVHGEVIHADIDIFDREAYFIDKIMEPLQQRLPELKIVLEHISTKESVEYLLNSNKYLAATITPQHLMFNRNHMLTNGVNPHLYCYPILKSKIHQCALRELITSGFDRIFLGSDSAPHIRSSKETSLGCAGCFSAPTALSSYAMVFEEMNALKHFEAFCSFNGPRFYGLPVNRDKITLVKKECSIMESIPLSNDSIIPFLAGKKVTWVVSAKNL